MQYLYFIAGFTVSNPLYVAWKFRFFVKLHPYEGTWTSHRNINGFVEAVNPHFLWFFLSFWQKAFLYTVNKFQDIPVTWLKSLDFCLSQNLFEIYNFRPI